MTVAKRVNFRFGDVVQLEATSGAKQSYRVQLVGVLPGLSLLVTAPDIRGQHVALAVGEPFTVRIFDGDDALSFPSQVLRCCHEPYAYLHLVYPQQIERVQVRNARRARLKLKAQINVLSGHANDYLLSARETIGPALPVTIRDISTAGVMVESPDDLGVVGTRVILTTTLAFDRIDGRKVMLPAEIRNGNRLVADDGDVSFHYGMQWLDLPAEADLALSAFVYRQLAAQLLQDPAA